MPKVSIIVPVYKVEKYLSRCIDSILNQTFSDFELILVDDGSPDRSGGICEEYAKKDDRVVVIHKENGGVSSARNVGINKAAGEYIMFVDSDDWIETNCLEILLSKETDFDIVVGGYRSVFKYKKIEYPFMTLKGDNRTLAESFVSLTNTNNFVFSYSVAKLYKNSIIKDNHIYFDENIKLGEDTTFNLEFYRYINRAWIVDKVVYNYNRNNDESASKKYFEDYYVYRKTTYDKLEKWLIAHRMGEYLKFQKIEFIYQGIYYYIIHCNDEEASKKIAEIYTVEENLFEECPELLSARLGGGYTSLIVQKNWSGLIRLWKKQNRKLLFKIKLKSVLKTFLKL